MNAEQDVTYLAIVRDRSGRLIRTCRFADLEDAWKFSDHELSACRQVNIEFNFEDEVSPALA